MSAGGGAGAAERPEHHALEVGGERLALRWQAGADGASPAFLYLHGFGSSQGGDKATYFRRRAAEAGIGFCSFDFRGHGESGGSLADLTFSRCLADAAAALGWLRRRSRGPRVVFGSSMGAAVGLWLAAGRPADFAAALAIAPALAMERAFADNLGEEGVARWRDSGSLHLETDLVDAELGWGLMDDLERYPAAELARRLRTPVLAFQGMRDATVPWHLAVDLAAASRDRGVEVHLFADGDHRLLDLRPRLWQMAVAFLGERGLLPR